MAPKKLLLTSLRKNPTNFVSLGQAEKKLMPGKYAFAYVSI